MAALKYASKQEGDLHLITCPPTIEAGASGALDAQVKEWIASPAKLHVLDMTAVKEIKSDCYRQLLLLNQSLKKAGKAMFCMNIPDALGAQIRQDGLTGVLINVTNIEDARKRLAGSSKPAFDLSFVTPFVAATKQVFETQVNLPLTVGTPRVAKPDERLVFEIAGVISLVSKDFRGTISMCFTAPVFLKIYENMVGEKHEAISREIEDAVGELLNIVFGQAKTVLNDEKGFQFEKALPTVLVGEKLKLNHRANLPVFILPFDSAVGPFHLEVLVERS